MRELSLSERKTYALEVLVELDNICRKYNLRYSLAAGTMIGAIRHKGFIPWDDDIDILMLREDYEKLRAILTEVNNPICRWMSYDTDKDYGYFFAKVIHKQTRVVDPFCNRKNAPLGVSVDIFPVDYLGENMNEATKRFKHADFWTYLLIACNWSHYFKSQFRSWFVEPLRFGLFVITRPITTSYLIKKINKICQIPTHSENGYYGMIMFGGKGCIYEKDFYNKLIDVEFEGMKFKCLKDFDIMLRAVYGNYMELPPPDKRVPPHQIKAFTGD